MTMFSTEFISHCYSFPFTSKHFKLSLHSLQSTVVSCINPNHNDTNSSLGSPPKLRRFLPETEPSHVLSYDIKETHLMKLLNRSWKAGKCNGSLYFLECMVTKGYQPDVIMCTKLIKGFFNSRNTEKATRVMEMLEKYGKPDVFAYNAVISGFCKANGIESAKQVLDGMKRKGFSQDVVTFNIMIGTFCSQGKIDLASKVFEELLRDNNCKPTLITCMILIEAHILEGGIDEGLKLLDEMLSRGIEPDTFTYIVRGLAKEGKVNQAFELVRTLDSWGVNQM